MPIYEYKCESCQEVIEIVQSFDAAPPEKCPQCGQGPLHKLVSHSSFILKGTGWYKDGYSGTSSHVNSQNSYSSSSDSSSSTSETSDTSATT